MWQFNKTPKAISDGKNHQIEVSNSIFYGSSGGLINGGLLTICSSRIGAYSRGGFLRGGGAIRGFTVCQNMKGTKEEPTQIARHIELAETDEWC